MPALCPAAVACPAEGTPVFAGIDSHKDTLAVAVIDGGGRAVSVRQPPNGPAGFTALAALAVEHSAQRMGIEGSTCAASSGASPTSSTGLCAPTSLPTSPSRSPSRPDGRWT